MFVFWTGRGETVFGVASWGVGEVHGLLTVIP